MVLRKPPPPRLENLNKWDARSEPRSPSSPSANSPSSARRAGLNRIPSQDSVYSPDLNTSPAFDLMPLEEAQRSPVGSPTSHPPSSWSEGLGDLPDRDRPATAGSYPTGTDRKGQWVPPALSQGAIEKGWPSAPGSHGISSGDVPVQLQSNNPFLKPKRPDSSQGMSDQNEGNDRHSHATTNSDPLSQTGGYIPMTARLSLLDSSGHESPWNESEQSHPGNQPPVPGDKFHDPSLRGSQHSIKISAPQEIYLQGGQSNPYAPAVVVQPSDALPNDPSGLHPTYGQSRLGSDAAPSAISTATSATSHELINLDGPDPLALGAGSDCAPSSAYSSEAEAKGEKALSDSQTPQTALSMLQPTGESTRVQQSPASSTNLSAADAANQKKQRSETYSIRQINWMDRTGQLLQSPILVQNQNGPCPLLALINALVLRADPKTQPPIVRALRTREQISLGLLIEALFEELTTCLGPHEEFPDIEALTQFLTMLHTGMNVNPRLTLEATDSVGTFLQTPDLRLYSTFRIPLIHGWLASWPSPEHTAMSRVGQYHEDIQLLPFRKQELEDRVMQGQSLSPDEEQKMADIQAIQCFVDIENTTQLSPFGLTQLTTQLAPGSVSIFFRNDHFSTLYKHPTSHQLFTLVTDAGYAGHAEVVWESLVDVTGFNSELFSGDFRAVNHHSSGSTDPTSPAGPRTSSAVATGAPATNGAAPAALTPQEQSDADYAYALSLQYQEEQRGQTPHEQGRSHRTSVPARTTSGTSPRMTNPPHRTSSVANGAGSRFTQADHEPDPDDPNAPPPPYEQAASGPRYSPPERRPQYGGGDIQSEQSPTNRHPRNQYPNRTANTTRYTSDRGKNSKDCTMM